MRGKGSKPNETVKIRTWDLVRLGAGEGVTGWLAGPHVGVWMHDMIRPKPCLACYGLSRDDCEGCEHKKPVRWKAYVPFYLGMAQAPTVALVTQDSQEVLERMPHKFYLTIRRGPREKAPLFVVPMLKQEGFEPRSSAHAEEQDILPWLPVMWKLKGVMTVPLIRGGGCAPDQVADAEEIHAAAPSPAGRPPAALPNRIKTNNRDLTAAESQRLVEGALKLTLGGMPSANGKHE